MVKLVRKLKFPCITTKPLYAFLSFLPYHSDDQILKFITILVIAFSIYVVDFKCVNASLRIY